MNRKTLPTLALIGALALAGCTSVEAGGGSSKDSAPSPKPSFAEPAPEPTSEPVPDPQEDMILAFGEAMTWENKVSLSVSARGPFTAGEYAAGATPGQEQIVFTLVITNNSTEVLEPSVYGTLSSGGAEASRIFDSGNPAGEISSGPSTAILPGQTIQWLEAYSVAD